MARKASLQGLQQATEPELQSDFSTVQGKHWYDPRADMSSQLGERGTPFSQFTTGDRTRWEYDPVVRAWVKSNLNEDDYNNTYNGSMDNLKARQAQAIAPSLTGLRGF